MNKSIYEEVLEIIDKNIFELPTGFAVLYEIRKRIEQAQKQAQKQEKLLGLYRELNNKILHTYDMFERMTNKEWTKFVNLQQQIKEKEDE